MQDTSNVVWQLPLESEGLMGVCVCVSVSERDRLMTSMALLLHCRCQHIFN